MDFVSLAIQQANLKSSVNYEKAYEKACIELAERGIANITALMIAAGGTENEAITYIVRILHSIFPHN